MPWGMCEKHVAGFQCRRGVPRSITRLESSSPQSVAFVRLIIPASRRANLTSNSAPGPSEVSL